MQDCQMYLVSHSVQLYWDYRSHLTPLVVNSVKIQLPPGFIYATTVRSLRLEAEKRTWAVEIDMETSCLELFETPQAYFIGNQNVFPEKIGNREILVVIGHLLRMDEVKLYVMERELFKVASFTARHEKK